MTTTPGGVEQGVDAHGLAARMVRVFELAQEEADALRAEARRDAETLLQQAGAEADAVREQARREVAEQYERVRTHHEQRLEHLQRAAQESAAELQELEQRRSEVMTSLHDLWDVLNGLAKLREALAETLGMEVQQSSGRRSA